MTKPPTYVKEAAEEIRAKTGNLIFRLLGSAHALPLTEIESILLKYPPRASESLLELATNCHDQAWIGDKPTAITQIAALIAQHLPQPESKSLGEIEELKERCEILQSQCDNNDATFAQLRMSLKNNYETEIARLSTSLKEEQREVMPNATHTRTSGDEDSLRERVREAVTPPPKSEPLAMRVCPNTGCGKFYKGKVAVIMGDKSFADCPICKGKGQVPVIPPASTLREIYAQYYSSKGIDPVNSGCTWHDDALEAVASAVSLRCKEEIEGHHVSMEVMRKEIVAQQMEIARLTTLANENAVLAVEREAENARKDAVIEEARGVIIGYFELIKHQKSKEEHLEHVRSVLALLAQKGKS